MFHVITNNDQPKGTKLRLHGLFNVEGARLAGGDDIHMCRRVIDIIASTTTMAWQSNAASRLRMYMQSQEWFAQAADYVAEAESRRKITQFIADMDGNYVGDIKPVSADLSLTLSAVGAESYGRQTVLFQTLVLEYLAAKGWESLALQGDGNKLALKN